MIEAVATEMKIQREEIVELEKALVEAITKSDIPFLEKILHDDLLFLVPDGSVITKEMDLASHRAGEMEVEKIVPMIEDISIMDDTAVAVVVYETKGKMLGHPIEGQFRYIRIWKKFNDGIKVIGGSCFQLTNMTQV